jgi:hypothetical protein
MPALIAANNFSKSLKTHPAKFAVLAALMLTMGGLWFKIIFLAPSGVSAKTSDNAQSSGESATKDKPMLSASRKQFFEWRRQNLQPLTRNLFEIQYERFPDDDSAPVSQTAQSVFWEQLAKSMDYRTDQEIARKTLVENLRKQALVLRPKAVMSVNGNQTALIDGSLVCEGDLINGFKIIKIHEDRLIVEREGVRLEVLSSEN